VPENQLITWISAFNCKPQDPKELFRVIAEKCPNVSIQLVALDMVPGLRYLELATVNAIKSYHSKQPIAKTLSMELLLYISAEKQIVRALKRVGVTTQTRGVVGIAIGSSRDVSEAVNFLSVMLGQDSEDRLLDEWPRQRIENVRSGFDIGDKELKAIIRPNETEAMAVERLAAERSAMLAAKK